MGGATSDESYYNPGGVTRPDWYNFAQTTVRDDYAAMWAVAQTLNSSLILGLNFRLAKNLTYTLMEVEAIANITGLRGVVLELGNEPELYECETQKYRPCVSSITPPTQRALPIIPCCRCADCAVLSLCAAQGWSFDDYMSEWDYVTSAIMAAYPHAPLHLFQAGAFSGGWTPQMASFVIPRQERVHSASFHRYAYPTCNAPLTVDIVLSDSVALPALQQPIARGMTYASLAHDIETATNESVLVSLGECGMMWCLDGDRAAMDTFASSLWVLDYNLAVASFNVSSAVYYMGWQPPPVFRAAPFIVPDASKDAIEVLPIMYGMWMFALASRNQARIVNSTRTDSTTGLSQLKTWTLRDADDSVIVVAIHKLYNATSNATLAVSVAVDRTLTAPIASAVRMMAPSVQSPLGISLAGLTWEGTTDGRARPLNGSLPVVERVQGEQQGGGVWLFTVQVKPGEAVLISIPTQHTTTATDVTVWEKTLIGYLHPEEADRHQPLRARQRRSSV